MSDWPFNHLKPLSFDLIMADPAWLFENWSEAGEGKNAVSHYDCMTLDEICALPVGHLAAGDCLLWLWATNPMLDQAFTVMRAWGFAYKTAGTWVKKTRRGKLAFGTGYILRSANEPFLIGTVGTPQVAKNVRSAFEGVVRAHSQKPDEAYAEAERLMPQARRADLFSRQSRPGWTAWGKEAGRFDEVPA